MTHSSAAETVILIVEDNDANLLLTRTVLERAGYQVQAARSAEDAKRQLDRMVPSLILMDVGLPGQDGLSLTRELRAMMHTATIPIVALTAHAMQDDHARILSAGCDGYVSKPFRARHLLDEIRSALQRDRP